MFYGPPPPPPRIFILRVFFIHFFFSLSLSFFFCFFFFFSRSEGLFCLGALHTIRRERSAQEWNCFLLVMTSNKEQKRPFTLHGIDIWIFWSIALLPPSLPRCHELIVNRLLILFRISVFHPRRRGKIEISKEFFNKNYDYTPSSSNFYPLIWYSPWIEERNYLRKDKF